MAVQAGRLLPARWRPGRGTLVALHRWASLVVGALIALLGLSGSLMVWQAEIDAALNPAWFAAPASTDARASCPRSAEPIGATLAVLARDAPAARPSIVLAPAVPGAAWQVWERRDAQTSRRTEHFIDPDCGRTLGARERGALRLDAAHAVPLLYEFHTRWLAGPAGERLTGSLGLVLAGLIVSGVALAWPRRSSRVAWRRALTVAPGAPPVRWWSDLHRATGLWTAPILLLLAVTGAAMVFDDSVRAAVGWVTPLPPRMKAATAEAPVAPVAPAARLSPEALVARAEAQFPDARWTRISLPAQPGGPVEVRLLQPGEPRADTGSTRVRMAADGSVRAVTDPLAGPLGQQVLDWRFPLHSAEAFGVPLRLVWTLCGGVPALCFGSGCWLWWRRRRLSAARR